VRYQESQNASELILESGKKRGRIPDKSGPDDRKGSSMIRPHQRIPDDSNLLALIRELYSRHPEYRYHEAWELAHVLWSLGYVEEIPDEAELSAAIEVARTDDDPDRGAA
jgi:hypothetical protein